jgi:GT2 family glycosyltransferase
MAATAWAATTSSSSRVGVVVINRNRREELLSSLSRLLEPGEAAKVVVVDNGSTDGSIEAVRGSFPGLQVVALGTNRGSAARTVGAQLVGTPYVAFSDDDSWWEPGALTAASELLDRHPALGLIAARVLVGDEQQVDETCEEMARSPLQEDGLPGPGVLGFIACGSIVRRSAFLEVGGFQERLGIGGEEELLALDLAAGGWHLVYVPEVVALHVPSDSRDDDARRRIVLRNSLWCSWMRRSRQTAVADTAAVLRGAVHDPVARRALTAAVRGLPWAFARRRAVPPNVEAAARAVQARGRARVAA